MPKNKFAIIAVVLAILTIIVSMMLSMDTNTIISTLGILLGLGSIVMATIGIVRYSKDKTIKGLGFCIAGILIALWGLITILLKTIILF